MLGRAALQMRELLAAPRRKVTPQTTPIPASGETPWPVASPTREPAPYATKSISPALPIDVPEVARIWLLDRERPPPSRPTAPDHASRLLHWVCEAGLGGKLVLAQDLQKIYPVMCEELDWMKYPWQTVACHLRRLTGGEKIYKWVEGRRLRVYRIVVAPYSTTSALA